jgi:hypothetical protein
MMDEEKNNRKVQFFLNKQYQESIKQLGEAIKTNALAAYTKQFSELSEIAVSPSLKLAEALSSANFLHQFNFANIAKQNEEVLSKLIFQQQKIYQELNSNITNNIASLALDLSRAELAIASIANLPQINIENLNKVYENEIALEEIANNSGENILEDLYQFFREKIKDLPKGKISAQGILQIYMAIMTTLLFVLAYSQYQINQQTSDNLSSINKNQIKTNEILESLNQEVIPLINHLSQNESEELIYIVIKGSPIRAHASGKSDTLYRVYPNQPVKIIDDQKRWFYVEYFDYKESIPKMGYIYKGNVQQYNPE